MAAITSANVANAIVKLVASKALPGVLGNLVMGNLVNRDFEPTLQQAGDTVNVPIPAILSANAIAEGGTVTTQAVSLGNAQVVLNIHREASFEIPDVTKALASPDLMDMYLGSAFRAIAESIEVELLAQYAGFSTTDTGAAATALTEATIDLTETTLFNSKVPQNEPLNLVVGATPYSQLRQLPRFSEAQTVGNPAAIASGALGKIKNFNVYRSQFVTFTGGNDSHNMAFHKNAIGLVIRRLPQPLPGTGAIAEYAEVGNFGLRVVMSYKPASLGQLFTVDVLFGAAVLRPTFGVEVHSS